MNKLIISFLIPFIVNCSGPAAESFSHYDTNVQEIQKPCDSDAGVQHDVAPDATHPAVNIVDGGTDSACDLLSVYYSSLQAAKCVHVITIVPGESCEDSMVRIEDCLNNSSCRHSMEVGCPSGLPALE